MPIGVLQHASSALHKRNTTNIMEDLHDDASQGDADDEPSDIDIDEEDETQENVPFALTPAIAIQGVINYNKTSGRKMYSGAIAKLDEELYDCKPDGLYQFLQALNSRAQDIGWSNDDGILMIPGDAKSDNPVLYYLIDNYGVISLAQIRAFEATYLRGQNRAAQDTYMLYKCLMNSISKEGKLKILIWKNQYTIDSNVSGNLLLKVIIRESHLDTNATTATIRTKLSSLDTYLPTIGCDITKFNGYVRLLIDSLAARGETTQDLLSNLFKGYQAASDKTFVEYIGRKLEKYEEGDPTTAESLMEQADNKFKLLKVHNKWNAPSQEEEKILALEARVKKLTQKDGRNRSKGKDQKSKRDSKTSEQPSWFNKEPAAADLKKPKSWKGKDWWWCSPRTGGKCTGQHRCHKPSKCEGKAFKFPTAYPSKPEDAEKKSINRKNPNKGKDDQRKLQLAKALAAQADNMSEDDQ